MGLLTLIAQLGMDTAGFDSGLKHAETSATQLQARIGKLFATRSTITNAREQKDAARDYTQWWSRTLQEREELETAASVRAASRSNRARMLLRQRAAAREKAINEEVSAGSTPAAWARFKREWFNASEVASTGWRRWGGEAGRQIARIGKSFVAAFAIRQVLANISKVAEELQKLDPSKYNISGFTEDRRRRELEKTPANRREDIALGEIAMEDVAGGIRDFTSKGAGLWAFAAQTVREAFRETAKTKDVTNLIWGWGSASERAAAMQTETMQQLRAFSMAQSQKIADDESAKRLKEQAADEERIFQLRLKRMKLDEQFFAISVRMRGKSGLEREEYENMLFELRQKLMEKPVRKTAAERESEAVQIFDPLRRIGAFNQGTDTGFKLVTLQERIARATERTAENTGEGPL